MSKLLITGITFIILAIASGFIQNIFYGYVDSDGILRDSLFLPFTFIFLGVGMILLILKVLWRIIAGVSQRKQ